MPRYHFHVRHHLEFVEDEYGVELPDLEAAKSEAFEAARDIMNERVSEGEIPDDGSQFEIMDQNRAIVAVVPFKKALC